MIGNVWEACFFFNEMVGVGGAFCHMPVSNRAACATCELRVKQVDEHRAGGVNTVSKVLVVRGCHIPGINTKGCNGILHRSTMAVGRRGRSAPLPLATSL